MKLLTLLFCFALATIFTRTARAEVVTSPDGQVAVEVTLHGGQWGCQVSLARKSLLGRSPLGLVTSDGDFSHQLKLVEQTPAKQIRHEYSLPNGKRSHIAYQATQCIFTVENSSGQRLGLVVQVSNDGVALAYRLLRPASAEVTVNKELTGFGFPANARSFLHPMHRAKEGWSRTFPSYEAHYLIDRPVGEPSTEGVGWCFPALFHVPEVGWALVSETGVDGDFCGSHLAHESTGGVYRIAYPQTRENLESDPVAPTVQGNSQLPWRTIYVGSGLAPIVESTFGTDLVKPEYEIAKLPHFGKSAWSWLFLKDGQTVYDVQTRFVDMASELGWTYLLVDAMWDQQIGKEKIAELVQYAKGKGVAILLWYNSNGNWNDAPQTPKNRMHEPDVRESEMTWMEQVGVAGIKVDFFGGDKQAVMRLYEAILRDAARHKLAVNFHGSTTPRGWERMFPNYVTNEAVMGMEFCTFEQINADLQPEHCTVLPFTRNVVGPMDFTPVILSDTLGPNGSGPRRRTTDAFELALLVVYQSGVQHLGVTPDQIAAQPQEVRDYLRAVPTVWDETRLLGGYPGDFAVIARRAGDQWYVGAINGKDSPRKLALELAFAGEKGWDMLLDGDTAVESRKCSSIGGTLDVTLPPRGGVVLWQVD